MELNSSSTLVISMWMCVVPSMGYLNASGGASNTSSAALDFHGGVRHTRAVDFSASGAARWLALAVPSWTLELEGSAERLVSPRRRPMCGCSGCNRCEGVGDGEERRQGSGDGDA